MRSTVRKSADVASAKGDLLVVAVATGATVPQGPALEADGPLGGAIAAAIRAEEIDGKAGSSTVFHTGGALPARRVAGVGVGDGAPDDWREAGAAAARAAGTGRVKSVAIVPPADTGAAEVAAFAEGFGTAAYRFDRFKSSDGRTAVDKLAVHSATVRASDLARAERIVDAVNAARDLVNTPSNHLTPTMLADYARGLADGVAGLKVTVLDRARLEKMGAGALLAVAQGSAQPPRMIVMRYTPPAKGRASEVLGLVGKAVTFDTGGISIKPSGGMEEMKMDMGGGAAVIEATALIARLGLPVEVLTVVPSTENMPSGTAIKPGDVVTALNGKTIEILNTDAEGRLILADALTYAARQGATRLVDFATLTGAIVVALGEVYAGLFGSDDEWTGLVREASETSGDIAWPLPLHKRYRPMLDSKVADIANISNKRQAGSILAAEFLREFTEDVPWAHVDIAGTGMVGGAGTGFGVRLALSVAERLAAGTA
ncbi:MAG TPA: leucyl aminopeptidase [Miltoncostaea sp.]|nr:leucyl aminopeptidase [Miltoncostaea sp.]